MEVSSKWTKQKQFGNVWSGITWPGLGLETNKSWSYLLYGQEILSFLNCSRAGLEPDHPLIQRALKAISSGITRREREADHSLPVPWLRMRGVTRTLPNTPSWPVEIYRLVNTIIPSWPDKHVSANNLWRLCANWSERLEPSRCFNRRR